MARNATASRPCIGCKCHRVAWDEGTDYCAECRTDSETQRDPHDTPTPAHPGPWRVKGCPYKMKRDVAPIWVVNITDGARIVATAEGATEEEALDRAAHITELVHAADIYAETNDTKERWENRAVHAEAQEIRLRDLLSQYREALADLLGTIEIVLAENGQRGKILSETMRHIFEGHVDDYRALLAKDGR